MRGHEQICQRLGSITSHLFFKTAEPEFNGSYEEGGVSVEEKSALLGYEG